MIAQSEYLEDFLKLIGDDEEYQHMVAEASSRNSDRLVDTAVSTFKPSPPAQYAEWCEREIKLSGDTERGASNLDLTRRPWWRDVIDCYNDPEVRYINVPGATQIGKTISLISLVLACAQISPAPGMVVTPDRDSAIEFRDRVYANALSTPALRNNVPPKYKWNARFIDLGTMRVYLAWSGSRQRLRGKACKYVWLTEVDVYADGDDKAGDPVKAADQRVKSFFRFVIFRESSPSQVPSQVVTLEEASSARYRWNAPCPKCGHWQEMRFFVHDSGPYKDCGGVIGLKDEHGEWRKAEEVRETVTYKCEKGCGISQSEVRRMVVEGKWAPYGSEIDEEGNILGDPPRSRRSVGFNLWSIHSDTITIGDIAAAYIEAISEAKLPEFFGNWLGRAWQPRTKIPTWEVVGRTLASQYPSGTVPPEAWFLTAGADVQDDVVKYVVRAWAPHKQSWLVDWGRLERTEGDETDLVKSDLAQLSGVLARKYAVGGDGVNVLGQSFLSIRLLGCDANHRTMDVHSWIQSLPESMRNSTTGRVRAVRGDHKVDPDVLFRPKLVDKNARTGEVYKGGLRLWGIYVYHYYQDLAERLAGDLDQRGAWHVTSDCLNKGRAYLKEVCNFHKVLVNKKWIWKPRKEHTPVDYWDCETYGSTCADMVVGGFGWTEEGMSALRGQVRRAPRKADSGNYAER